MPSKQYGEGDYSDYYDYLADGTKILHEYSDGQQDHYIGSLVYYSNGDFSVSFGGGRLVSEGNTTAAHYFLTDHLGSTRIMAKVTPTGREDLDRKDYYPFGKAWEQPDMPTSDNRYTFSGKEEQLAGTSSAHYLDFSARFYDPEGVIFIQQDPLLEKYFRIGAYNYCAGNPIRFSDKKGQSIKDAVAGFMAGISSNVSGNSALRDSYTPANSGHYNTGLAAADATSFVAGAAAVVAGATAVIGGGTVFSGGTAAAAAIPAGAAISDAGILAIGMGVTMMSNANKNASQGYNRGKGPKANNGESKPHGNSDHNAKIDEKINSIRGEKATDIRKNQIQVNAAGERVGNNRPDVQYNKDGKHYNYEVDRSATNNAAHEQVIKNNDPSSIFEGEIIK